MVTYTKPVDEVFRALADKSRRRLLDRLFRRDGQSLRDLCARAGMTRFGVMKHLRVLEGARLVVPHRQGREKLHYLNPMPIRLLHDRWVGKYRAPLAAALSELKSRLEEPVTQVYELFIRTPPERLWDALTNGEVTKHYFFGETVRSDFRPGSEWHSTGPQGARDVEGEVLECERPRRLVISWHILYDAELAQERSRVTYSIEKRGEVCKLTLLHDCAEAPKTARHVSADGWQLVLSGLKTLLETGEPMPMPEAAK
jgi:uncharacterized protein YndB with AHSA1/START domain